MTDLWRAAELGDFGAVDDVDALLEQLEVRPLSRALTDQILFIPLIMPIASLHGKIRMPFYLPLIVVLQCSLHYRLVDR